MTTTTTTMTTVEQPGLTGDAERIRGEVLRLLKVKPAGVTFAEIADAVHGFDPIGLSDTSKVRAICGASPNQVLWAPLSAAAQAAMMLMFKCGELHYRGTSPLVYAASGGRVMSIPPVTRLKPTKSPRWCPVLVMPGLRPDLNDSAAA